MSLWQEKSRHSQAWPVLDKPSLNNCNTAMHSQVLCKCPKLCMSTEAAGNTAATWESFTVQQHMCPYMHSDIQQHLCFKKTLMLPRKALYLKWVFCSEHNPCRSCLQSLQHDTPLCCSLDHAKQTSWLVLHADELACPTCRQAGLSQLQTGWLVLLQMGWLVLHANELACPTCKWAGLSYMQMGWLVLHADELAYPTCRRVGLSYMQANGPFMCCWLQCSHQHSHVWCGVV